MVIVSYIRRSKVPRCGLAHLASQFSDFGDAIRVLSDVTIALIAIDTCTRRMDVEYERQTDGLSPFPPPSIDAESVFSERAESAARPENLLQRRIRFGV